MIFGLAKLATIIHSINLAETVKSDLELKIHEK
jgi:hypothetical protein